MPAKVHLDTLDAYKEVPKFLRGVYDVVHVRLILPGILDGNPSAIINHCKELLSMKPRAEEYLRPKLC